ncbi:MAG TPA: hypothetical protein VHM70_24425 [Polyangiaceae bacterium]|jgi:hypothetical protein|nr:hypothetical protein [Polyangiaceae bacterium]
MIDRTELQRRARRKLLTIQRRRNDVRYQRVVGRFVAEGLLHTNQEVAKYALPIRVEDVLWAGEVEPRLLELLPALIVKQPSMFVEVGALPEDLAQAVRRLRRNLDPAPFRNIPGEKLREWLPRVGRVGAVPARLKSFRLKPEDLRLLSALAEQLGVSETEVVRRGLRALA